MSKLSSIARVARVALALAVSAASAGAVTQDQFGQLSGWTSVTAADGPLQLSYPASVFAERASPDRTDGRVFVSHDGRARLVVGTFPNDAGASLASYRTQLLDENYATAALDYTPVRKHWFVISGTLGGMMFYERVNFACDGRLIASWAMLYPVAERQFYDRVVEAVAPTFKSVPGSCE